MKLSDHLTEDNVFFLPDGLGKCETVRYLVMNSAYFSSEKWSDSERESLIRMVLKREELGSTGIGRGFACPHTKHPDPVELVVHVAYSAEGIEFQSLDGEPVHLLFFWVSRADQPGAHLQIFEAIARFLRSDVAVRLVKESGARRDASSIIEIIKEYDGGGFVW